MTVSNDWIWVYFLVFGGCVILTRIHSCIPRLFRECRRKDDGKKCIQRIKSSKNSPTLLVRWMKTNPPLSVKILPYYPGERNIASLYTQPSEVAIENRNLELSCAVDTSGGAEMPTETTNSPSCSVEDPSVKLSSDISPVASEHCIIPTGDGSQ
nr:PREDICTED: uncharacterized protein LOC106706801 [Latimeria chalumnae]|eukprot:XP_014353717.1 PREDICTED: uncharacterized protein LOC106706801 [Latimeria chalumnae]